MFFWLHHAHECPSHRLVIFTPQRLLVFPIAPPPISSQFTATMISHVHIHVYTHFPELFCCNCCLLTTKCLTLVTPWTVTLQAPLSMGFPRQEHWSGLPFPPPGDLPNPEIEPASPAWAGGFSIPQSHWGSLELCTHLRVHLLSTFLSIHSGINSSILPFNQLFIIHSFITKHPAIIYLYACLSENIQWAPGLACARC